MGGQPPSSARAEERGERRLLLKWSRARPGPLPSAPGGGAGPSTALHAGGARGQPAVLKGRPSLRTQNAAEGQFPPCASENDEPLHFRGSKARGV